MKTLKDFLLKLTLPQKALLGAILLAVAIALIYRSYVSPRVIEFRSAKNRYDIINNSVDLKKKQLERLHSAGTGGFKITDAQKAVLEGQGNKIFNEAEIPEFLETIRELAREAGAKNTTVEEGEAGAALVQAGGAGEYFVAKKLPLKVLLHGNYETVSSFLFELRGLRRFLDVADAKLYSKDYTSNLTAEITILLYYSET